MTQIWGGVCTDVGDDCCRDAQHPHLAVWFGVGTMSEEQCRDGANLSRRLGMSGALGVSAPLVGRSTGCTASGKIWRSR